MKVRVCGPNLNDQSKGTFHVHHHDCSDLLRYGPGRREGGDQWGARETIVDAETKWDVVSYVYSDQIAEDGDFPDDADSYLMDLWFAPCCDSLPDGGPDEHDDSVSVIWECWVAGERDSFVKLEHQNVAEWVQDRMANMKIHQVINICPHYTNEYS